VPLITLLLFELVTVGATGAGDTMRLNIWFAVPAELSAVNVNVYVLAGTVASIVKNPFALFMLTPDGAPLIE
jgi:hypothetical protein